MFWTDDVLVYLDAVSFVHKRNPCADALAPAARVWRTPGEGLQLTAKGSKDVGGGNICHFIVGISLGAVKRKLRQDAITNRIVCENLNSFRNRIIEIIRTYDKNIINKTISSVHKRLYQITKTNGCRTKY